MKLDLLNALATLVKDRAGIASIRRSNMAKLIAPVAPYDAGAVISDGPGEG